MHQSHALGTASATVAALVLTGCLGGVLVDEPVYRQRYVNGELEYAAKSGALPTGVYGTPFAGGSEAVASATTTAMKGANRGPEVTFTPAPAGSGSGGYHVVMLFNPVTWVWDEDLCKDPARYRAAPTDGRVRLVSAFCFGDMLVSIASGSVAGARSLDDPAFRSLVRQVTLSLFPAHDRIESGGDGTPA